jgi:hypothetical protein
MRNCKHIITLLMAVALAAPVASSTLHAADPLPNLVTEHLMIDAADTGIKLYVRNKRPVSLSQT